MLIKRALCLLLFFLAINPAYSVQLSDQLSPEESSPTSIEEESKAVRESLANKLEGKPVLSDNSNAVANGIDMDTKTKRINNFFIMH